MREECPVILVIDNYDSFTYNLVQYLGELGASPVTYRNDEISLAQIRDIAPEKIIISPGPGYPSGAGISEAVIREYESAYPILGVCLGHQAVGEVYGARIVKAGRLMHGKVSAITHDGKGLFRDVANPFEATRYHSLLIDAKRVPSCLEVTAETAEGEIMGIRHRKYAVYGVQFHPESILTREGKKILANFLTL